jgi:hypothetical protein
MCAGAETAKLLKKSEIGLERDGSATVEERLRDSFGWCWRFA